MKKDTGWVRRRWLDFRQGNSIYLIFIIFFADLITIQYKLFLEKVHIVNTVTGGNIFGFAIFFIAIYIPLSIIIGVWHRKNQYKVEADALFKENKIGATMWLFVIDLIDGKITEKEKQDLREMLLKIIKGKGKSVKDDRTENNTY